MTILIEEAVKASRRRVEILDGTYVLITDIDRDQLDEVKDEIADYKSLDEFVEWFVQSQRLTVSVYKINGMLPVTHGFYYEHVSWCPSCERDTYDDSGTYELVLRASAFTDIGYITMDGTLDMSVSWEDRFRAAAQQLGEFLRCRI